MVPGVLHVASVSSPDRTVTSGDLGDITLSLSLSNIDLSYSLSHALAYKSSRLMMISGSGCHSRGVTSMSGIGCRGVNWCSFILCRICVLLVPILRTTYLLLGNTFQQYMARSTKIL